MWRHFHGDFIVYAAAKVVAGLAAFALLRLLTHAMAPQEYGAYALLYAVVTILAIVSTSYLSTSIIRFVPRALENNRARHFEASVQQISMPTVLASVALTVVATLAAAATGLIALTPLRALGVLMASGAAAAFNLYMTHAYALRRRRAYAAMVSVQALTMVGGAAMIGFAPFEPVAAAIFALALSYVVALVACRVPPPRLRPGILRRSGRQFREIVRYGAPLVALNVTIQLNQYVDQFMLRAMRTLEEVGLYAAHYTFADKIVYALGSVVSLAAIPLMFREWEAGRKDASYHIVWRAAATFGALGVAMFVAMHYLGGWVLSLVTAREYASGAAIVPFVLAGALFSGLAAIFSEVLTMQQRTTDLAICYMVGLAAKLGLNLLLIPTYGIMGCAYATTIAFAILLVVVFTRVQLVSGISSYFTAAFERRGQNDGARKSPAAPPGSP